MKLAALLAALLTIELAAANGGAQAPAPYNTEPLQRRISVHLRDVALRDALDRIALAARVRLSYSGENLPLDRLVSVSHDTITLGDLLDELLHAYPVQPLVVAADHIVIAPREATAADTTPVGIALLDRVVVTGSVIGASERPLPVALDVIRGGDIERRGETTLSSVVDGAVPGMWIWEQQPTAMIAQYGSIRGASSFRASYPKVYIDGVEVANPLLLTELTPELVERVEVIRGPQGAALYGADAISGVVNIISRHDGTGTDGTHTLLRSSAGYSTSAFTNSAVPVQEHALTVRGGSNLRSGGVTVAGSTTGEYVPRAFARELRGVADARVIGSTSTFTASARVYGKNSGIAPNPLLMGLNPPRVGGDSKSQQLRMYSLGSTLTLAPSDQWTYTLTAGLDGYSLANVSDDLGPIPSVADTALRQASGAADRGTMRLSAVTTMGTPAFATTVTFAGEHSVLRDRTAGDLTWAQYNGSEPMEGPDAPRDVVSWSSNSGISAQANVAILDAAYLTAGLRGERVGQWRGLSQSATLPLLGGALVHDFAHVTVKLRGAYGKGIRTPRSSQHILTHEGRYTLANPNLAPEEQSGTELGTDIILLRALGLHVTRFDQTASGLIQTVVIDSTSSGGPGERPVYQLQNVGEITNRGWEAQASLALRSVSVAGAATFIDSRVHRLAAAYTGDLRAGDRMLGVPARTVSVTAAWMSSAFRLASTLSRASDWVNYDRLALADTLIKLGSTGWNSVIGGDKLRQFWINYPGSTRLRATVSRDVWRGTTLTLTGENLLNYQRGEPDSITIVPGRTLSVGLRARF